MDGVDGNNGITDFDKSQKIIERIHYFPYLYCLLVITLIFGVR